MSGTDTAILAPFVAAFLVFVFRFYSREGANSIVSTTFLCAALTIILAGTYLSLGVSGYLPLYGTLTFGLTGTALLVLAILRMFRL